MQEIAPFATCLVEARVSLSKGCSQNEEGENKEKNGDAVSTKFDVTSKVDKRDRYSFACSSPVTMKNP